MTSRAAPTTTSACPTPLTNVNDWGGEWLTEASLGTAKHLKTDFYTPLGALPDLLRRDEPGLRQDPATSSSRKRAGRRPGSAIWTPSTASPAWILPSAGIASPGAASPLGWRGKIGSVEIQNLTNADADASAWGPYIRFEHDTLDSRYFPYQGSTGTSRGLLPRRSRPSDGPSEQAEGVNSPAGDDQALVLGQAQPQPDAGRGGSSSQETVPLFVQDLGAVPHVRLPALPVERSIQPVWRIAPHLPGGGQRLPVPSRRPVPRGLPRARGVWDKGEDISIESSYTSGSPMGWRVSSVPSSSAMAWRRGARHVLSAIGHYMFQ